MWSEASRGCVCRERSGLARVSGMEHVAKIIAESTPPPPPRKTIVTSAVLEDGLLEMVHDRVRGTTAFVLSHKLGWTAVPRHVARDGRILHPLSATNNLLVHGVVLFASAPSEYGSKAELLAAIRAFLHRYVDLSPLFEAIAAHYVLLTWLYDVFPELPYLRVKGEPGSGKTRFLLTVGSICNKPIFASGASTVSPLFRMLDLIRGTLVFDEADFRFSDERAEITKILNNGILAGFPVLRSEQTGAGKEFNPRAYHVFGPKLLATRNGFEDRALESRFLHEELGARPLRRDVPIRLPEEHGAQALELRNKLLLFRLRCRSTAPPPTIDVGAVAPRIAQMFGPLLSLIDDKVLRRDVLKLAREYDGQMAADRSQELDARLLGTVLALWASRRDPPTVAQVAEAFRQAYPDEPFTPHATGRVLRRLGLRTSRRANGYALVVEDFDRVADLAERLGLKANTQASS